MIAFGCLAYSFITNDFSVLNVATQFKFPTAVALSSRGIVGIARRLAAAVDVDARVVDRRSFAVQPSFAGGDDRACVERDGDHQRRVFVVHAADLEPVHIALFPVPPDGRDLNPLLQDPAMVAHPPMLYMGYVGFSVAFAFAIAALIRRTARCDVGALVASMDHRRVDVSYVWHRARQFLGVLRTRLGRLVVLGSG